MAKGFKHGAGGTSLNFKVVGNPQPASPAENTIWVDTDRINNCYFSATQPENMVEYDLWFLTGQTSNVEFNALKKNGIQVYPNSVKQYVSGKLVDKTAKSYQGGKWVEWWTWDERTLYKLGDEYEGVTGGWVNVGGYEEYTDGTLTKNSKNMVLGAPEYPQMSRVTTNKAISLDDFNTLCVKVSAISGPTEKRLYVVRSKSGVEYSSQCDIVSTGTFNLDISGLTGEWYPTIMCFSAQGDSDNALTITEVWVK